MTQEMLLLSASYRNRIYLFLAVCRKQEHTLLCTNTYHVLHVASDFSCFSIVLSSERKSIHPGNTEPDATFPGENILHNFAALGNEPVAVTIPGELLENNYEG